MKKNFHRYVYTIEVLTEGPIPDHMSMVDILNEADYGSYSSLILDTKSKKVNGKTMAKALMNQGSDPEFFGIDENGVDIPR